MTEERDLELDELLSSLREENPTSFEMRRWNRALQAESDRRSWRHAFTSGRWRSELLKAGVAASIGVVIGASALPRLGEPEIQLMQDARVAGRMMRDDVHGNPDVKEISDDLSATVERVRIKLD
jgi:hypothetical protein